MMGSHRRQAVVLVLLMGIVSAIAQLAGVGTQRAVTATTTSRTLATIPGGTVPDRSSTRLAGTVVEVDAGETVRMSGSATLVAKAIGKARSAQAVCGIRYRRDGDAGWSLGTPYETVVLSRTGASDTVRIERSFAAPAADTYRMSFACHVVSPAKGAKVTASGTMRTKLGLPDGAATPVE
ncbi:MAG: hypothetical protein JWM86_1576 [Thermoleophilia bacterium]|nr:hypothetical protein [Thermoleophilia bacterium]